MSANLETIANDLHLASQSLQDLREKYDGSLNVIEGQKDGILTEINVKKEESLQNINALKTQSIKEIEQNKATSMSELNALSDASNLSLENKREEALNQIKEAKEQGLNEFETNKEEFEEKINSLSLKLNKKVSLLEEKISFELGLNDSLNDVLKECSKYKNIINNEATIILKDDFVFDEIISISRTDLSFVKIIPQNKEKEFTLKEGFETDILIAGYKAHMPTFENIKINANNKIKQHIIQAYMNSKATFLNCSFKNSLGYGVHCVTLSDLYLNQCEFVNNKSGLRVSGCSRANISNIKLNGQSEYALESQYEGKIVGTVTISQTSGIAQAVFNKGFIAVYGTLSGGATLSNLTPNQYTSQGYIASKLGN
ncbi:right-handed parallel beta-helix repeat-containing protein [Campylobacter jejuni]|uniref:right-handed parallel beta-helix repeat-containing protein n=1 Tax=Campylobacter jejuni TaxID=197 RepID=UPI000F7FD1DB|nr:right-handed parallel beta-helix repeat-containing protein [Campylobacter jejuni]RTK00946.1 hypothetical protein C3H41_08735 [Campylobacter jejuni]HEF7700805.1 hypothetical protein [Campylobacter jejuni]HEF7706177.1 hypothetical protein [Campylobacter jejuni]HEF8756373.1 hypothetical protein [Campylobacter jejuni]